MTVRDHRKSSRRGPSGRRYKSRSPFTTNLARRLRRTADKRPGPEVMHVQIPAHRQRIARLQRLGAEDVTVEQAQIAAFVQCRTDLVQHHTLDQQTEAPQTIGVEPVLAVFLAKS